MRYERHYNHRYKYDLILLRGISPSLKATGTFIFCLKMQGRQDFGPRSVSQVVEREAAVAAFNDANIPVQVLVTSMKVSATSINLQKDFADVVFVDVPSNAQST